jgi:hypothetical protein
VNEFLGAVRAAASRIIGERSYIAHPDDVDDITISEDSRAWPELAAVDAALATSAKARRAVGLRADEQVPAGSGIGFMFRWLSEYRDAGGSFHHLDDDVEGALAERLREFAARESFPAVVLTPIHGLALDAPLELDERTGLVVIRNDRDVRRAFDYTFSFPHSADWLQPARVALRQQIELPRDTAVSFIDALDRADRFVAALRLADITGLAPGAHVVAIQPPAFSLPATQAKAIRVGRAAMPAMTIRQPEQLGEKAAEVRELFAKLDANQDRTLAFAVRRFNDADERARDEDVVFDCFSALEALFADGATTEITYRLSLRAAKVLRATTEERVELFRRIKKLYATRSKVVHGGQVPRQRLVEDAADAKALLRAALTAWLDFGGYDGDGLDELLLS